jgi:putative tryptophan/tyrosine transport system substrate-binding protein
MRRREFITLVGGSAAAWPFVTYAQQSAMPLVGFLRDATAAGSEFIVGGLRKGLAEAGFVEGRNLIIDFAFTEGDSGRLPALAVGLVERRASVIVASALNATIAAKAATPRIPIVFAIANDAVEFGLVASLGHPGGNLTGVNYLSAELAAKRLGLMHEILPKVTDFALLVHPTYPESKPLIRDAQDAARAMGFHLEIFNATTEDEVATAFAAIAARGLGALLLGSHPLFTTHQGYIAGLAARYAIPTIYPQLEYAEAGGLIAYGPSLPEVYHLAGGYAGRILKGDKPADLPVVQPTLFEMGINLKTAKALKLDIPPTLLAGADKVIE